MKTQNTQNKTTPTKKTVCKLKPNGDFEKLHHCQRCPVTGEFIFLPANYTDVEPPPVKEFEKAQFDNGAWRIVKVDKGKQIFNKSNPQQKLICREDFCPPGWTVKDPEMETATGKAATDQGKLKPDVAKWDGKNDKWIVDTVKLAEQTQQAEIDAEEALIRAEMRAIAIERLGGSLKKVTE